MLAGDYDAAAMNRLPASFPVVRLFVSSTFRDWVHGRDLLQSDVFPAFDALCREGGARFRPVDLRWGIGDDAAIDQQALAICLAEIARCQRITPRPNFLILLGDRYGWRPLPARMPSEDFEEISAHLNARLERPLLRAWYLLDENSQPPIYLLRSRRTEGDAEPWQAVELRLGRAFRRTVSALGWSTQRRHRYEASATELEIRAGALDVSDAAEHVLCVRRKMRGPPPAGALGFDDADAPPEDQAAIAERRGALEQELRERLGARFVEIEANWDGGVPDTASMLALGQAVRSNFEGLLAERLETVGAADAGAAEARLQLEHARTLARILIGREDEIRRLHIEADTPGGAPMVLVGPRGSGKSSLLARLVVERLANLRAGQELVFAFVGLTSNSTSGQRLLDSLEAALARAAGETASDVRLPPALAAYDELALRFAARIEQAAAVRPVLLVIDALDQLDPADPARNLAWLPHRLPSGAAIIVSCAPGPMTDLLERKLEASRFMPLHPLAPAASEQLLEAWLAEEGRTLHGDQAVDARRAVRASGLPLHLRLIFEEVRRWRSFDGVPAGAGGRAGLPDTIQGAVDDLLWRLSQPEQHGTRLVERALAYLAAARNGLTDDEMTQLLSRDTEVMAEFRSRSPNSPAVDRLPDIVWLRLFADLEAYVVEREADGTLTLGWFHPAVAAIVEQRFLGDRRDAEQRHAHLADFFDSQPLYARNRGRERPNRRKLTELPAQLAGAGQWQRLLAHLLDPESLQATVRVLGPQAAIGHLDLTSRAPSAYDRATTEALTLLRATLRLAGHILARDPGQLLGQLQARLGRPAPRILEPLLRPRADDTLPRLRAMEPSFWRIGGPVVSRITAHGAAVTALVLTPDGSTAASASRDGSVKVWDLASERERYVLSLGADVLSLALTPDAQTLVAGTGSGVVAVFDLPSGTLRLRWQIPHDCRALAVMPDACELWAGGTERMVTSWNLADGSPLRTVPLMDSGSGWLALSADGHRLMVGGTYDYVTVIDLPAGTKRLSLAHGDDRWVSSLAIRADGRLGASGDWDRQLLLWDLDTGRRLRYLGGHDPNERISAIAFTPDGRRLYSASHRGWMHLYELEPLPEGHVIGPALAIGTGEHRITAIAIAADGRHAITAAEDCTLRVWDLTSRQETGLSPPRRVDDDDREVRAPRRGVEFGPWRPAPTLRLAPGKSRAPALHVIGPTADTAPAGAAGQAIPWPSPSRDDDDDDDPPLPTHLDVTLFGRSETQRLEQGPIDAAAISPDGHWLLCIDADGGAALWDLLAGRRVLHLGGVLGSGMLRSRPRTAAVWLAPEARRAMSISHDGAVHWWRLDGSGDARTVFRNARPPLVPVPGGDAVASCCEDGWLRLWSLTDGAVVARARVGVGAAFGFTRELACWLAPGGALGRFDLRHRRRLPGLNCLGEAACIDTASGVLLHGYEREMAIDGLHPRRGQRRLHALLRDAGSAACAVWLNGDATLAATVGPDLSLWTVGDSVLRDRISADAPFASCAFDPSGRQLTARLHHGREHSFALDWQ